MGSAQGERWVLMMRPRNLILLSGPPGMPVFRIAFYGHGSNHSRLSYHRNTSGQSG